LAAELLASGLALQELIYSCLDELRRAVPLDLCAYLHAADGHTPQLYLRTPDLADLDPAEAFDMFTAMRDLLEQGRYDAVVAHVAGFSGLAIPTRGESSHGLFLLGRRGSGLGEDEETKLAALARIVGSMLHRLAGTPSAPSEEPEPTQLTIEVVDGVARAEVRVVLHGEPRLGRAEAPSSAIAVARAVVAAAGPGITVGPPGEVAVDGDRVMVVVARTEDGAKTVGAVIEGPDPLQAVAASTLAAVRGLSRAAS
jgi:hypothetical protein